ncbi:hypothetical protein DL93DRAFT_2168846 [Clavulina sp. PMI_390]|nr:hypothetical protein DL93DRAFT_2168846 [Clavulina sp. PMI_390]
MTWNNLLTDEGALLLRYPGDVALMLSYPILWWRLYTIGFSAVSIETQILHALVFFFRYICDPHDITQVSTFVALGRCWLIVCSISTVFVLVRHRQRSPDATSFRPRMIFLSFPFLATLGWISLFLFPIFLALIPTDDARLQAALRDMAWYLLSRIPWSISQILGTLAMIPQLRLLYRWSGTVICEDQDGKPTVFISPPEGKFNPDLKIRQVDDPMWYYILSVATFRTFYIIYWFASDGQEAFSPQNLNLMRIGAVAQAVIIHGFIFNILFREKRARRWLKQQRALQPTMPHDASIMDLLPADKTPVPDHKTKSLPVSK